MKRVIAITIFLTLLIASPIQAAQQTTGWKQAYKKEITSYMNSDEFTGDSLITLIDIDRDGTPELFAGDSYRTVNSTALAFTYKKGKLLPLIHKGSGAGSDSQIGFKLGMAAFKAGETKVFKDKKTGKYKVIAKDGGGGVASWNSNEYVLELNGAVLTSTEISTFDGNEDGEEFYSFKGKKVTKAQYNKSRTAYYAQFKQIPSEAKTLEAFTFFNDEKADIEDYVNRLLGL